jgi:hypothetical protein
MKKQELILRKYIISEINNLENKQVINEGVVDWFKKKFWLIYNVLENKDEIEKIEKDIWKLNINDPYDENWNSNRAGSKIKTKQKKLSSAKNKVLFRKTLFGITLPASLLVMLLWVKAKKEKKDISNKKELKKLAKQVLTNPSSSDKDILEVIKLNYKNLSKKEKLKRLINAQKHDLDVNKLSDVFKELFKKEHENSEIAFAQDGRKGYSFYSQEELQKYLDNYEKFMSAISIEDEITQFNQLVLDEVLDMNDIKEINKDSESWNKYTSVILKAEFKIDRQSNILDDYYTWFENETNEKTKSEIRNIIQEIENENKNSIELIKDSNKLLGIDQNAYQKAIDSIESMSLRSLEDNKDLFSNIIEIESIE